MLKFRPEIEVYVCREPTDMRKAIDGLCELVQAHFDQQPQCGHVFVFLNHSRDKAKVLWWDKNGFILHYKRLEKHRFKAPLSTVDRALPITHTQLNGLLAGLDFMLMAQFTDIEYESIF